MIPKKEIFIMRFKRFISFSLGAAMLVSGGGVNAFAEERSLDDPAVGSVYSVGGLSTTKIVSTSKGRAYIKIRWNAVKGATGYKVYRKTKSGKYKSVATVKGGKLTYIAELLNSHTKYTFKVRAYKKSKGRTTFSKYSAAKSVTTRYGLGTYNYTDKAFSIKFPHDWDIELANGRFGSRGVYFELVDKNTDLNMASGSVKVKKMTGEDRKASIEDFARKLIDDAQSYYNPEYNGFTHGKFLGEDCVFVWNDVPSDPPEELDLHTNNGDEFPGFYPLVLIYENGYLYMIYPNFNTFYGNDDVCRKALAGVFDDLKLTYNK